MARRAIPYRPSRLVVCKRRATAVDYSRQFVTFDPHLVSVCLDDKSRPQGVYTGSERTSFWARVAGRTVGTMPTGRPQASWLRQVELYLA